MKKYVGIFLFLAFLAPQISFAQKNGCDAILSETDVRDTVNILAHPALEGRGTGQAGFDVAGLFLARELRNAGFLPLPNNIEGYFQTFGVYTGTRAGGEASRNVVGYIPGTARNEYIVIGAHYDHLGIVDGQMFPGADDNASGTTGVLEVARALGECAKSGQKLRRSIVIAFWGAEEICLCGSAHFVKSGLVPLDQIVTVFNLDMIGRNAPRQLAVIGAEHPTDFPTKDPILEKLLQEENARLEKPFAIAYDDGHHGGFFNASDSYSFFEASPPEKRIPILFFSSLLHEDYHQPTDTADKIDTKKLQRVAELTYQVVMRLATSSLVPVYTNGMP